MACKATAKPPWEPRKACAGRIGGRVARRCTKSAPPEETKWRNHKRVGRSGWLLPQRICRPRQPLRETMLSNR